ncbi:DUF3102 domain-containing protein [Sinorhizobium fredii]|uniref:DUF3102 domain-containing protein n=1 Tax=Rhizobium fredii TaxID=380 RepID=UPI003513F32A
MTDAVTTNELSLALAAAADRIRSLHKRSVESVVFIGRELRQVKDLLPHGDFLSWIDKEFRMTPRTAQNYMRTVDLCEKYETVSYLEASAIYALAAPSTPEPTRQEIISRIEGGEKLPAGEVKEIIADAKKEQAKAKVSPDQRKRDQQREARRRREIEKHRAEMDAANERRRQALRVAVALIKSSLSDRLEDLVAALHEAHCYDLARELSAPVNAYAAARDGY